MEFFKQQFDKLLLVLLVALFGLLAWWAIARNQNDLAEFATGNIKLFIGALLLRMQSKTDQPPIVNVRLPNAVTLRAINVEDSDPLVHTTNRP